MNRIRHRVRAAARVFALAGGLLLAGALEAQAGASFIYENAPIHPGCVHALVMQAGDKVPVITSVSLEGCRDSSRSAAPIQREGEVLFIEDEVLLGEGRFGYRHLATLDNGIFILGIRRDEPDGSVVVSLAAMAIDEEPVLRGQEVGSTPVLATLGEVRLRDMSAASVRTMGNVVRYSAGMGATRQEQTIDFSRIGRARKKKH